MAKAAESLAVWMNGERVASWSCRRGEHELAYDPRWVSSPQGRPLSLSLPFVPGNVPHRGEVVRSYFENLLPDRPEVRNRLRDRFKTPSAQAFDLLAELGRDCLGAVQILPVQDDPPDIRTIKGIPLSEEAISHQLEIAGGLRLPGFDLEDFRISLAGAQEKTAFLWHESQWQRPLGTTPSTHIFKLPLGTIGGMGILGTGSVENEWLCSRIVAAYGLPVAKAQMACFGNQRTLVVERFDRILSASGDWWIRRPAEDFCQAKGLPAEKKYEADGGPGIDAILSILEGSESAAADRMNFFKTQLVFWLLAASDGHAKNYSLFLGPRGSYRLAPLYDIMSLHPWTGKTGNMLPIQKLKMAMAVRGQNAHYHWASIQRRHWEATARRNGLGPGFAALLSGLIDQTPGVIRTVTAELPADFPGSIAEPIFQGISQAAARLATA